MGQQRRSKRKFPVFQLHQPGLRRPDHTGSPGAVVNNIIAGKYHHCVLIGNTDNTEFWNNVIAPGNRTGNLIWLRGASATWNLKQYFRLFQDGAGYQWGYYRQHRF